MIPFSFFAIQQLSSGVVRVNFSNTTWVQSGDVWTYSIPRVTHKSGLYPRTHIVDVNGHILTGVGIEFSIGGSVTLTAITPIPNFVAYFYGDNTEQPPQSSETFMFQRVDGSLYVRSGENWYYNTGESTTWQLQPPTFAPSGQYKQMTSVSGYAAIVTINGDVHIKAGDSASFGDRQDIPSSVKKVAIPGKGLVSLSYEYYVLCDNGDVYGKNSNVWSKIPFTEKITEMALNGYCLLLKSETGKVYAMGYNYHTEFPYYDTDPATSFYILKKSSAAGDYLYVSEIGQCGIVCLFKFMDTGKWYRTGLLLSNYSYVADFDGFSLNQNREVPYTYDTAPGYGVDLLRSDTNEVWMMKMYGSWQQFKLPDLYDGGCATGSNLGVTYMSLADHSAIHRFTDRSVPNYTVIPFPS